MGVEPTGLLAEGLMGTVSVLEGLCVCFCLCRNFYMLFCPSMLTYVVCLVCNCYYSMAFKFRFNLVLYFSSEFVPVLYSWFCT